MLHIARPAWRPEVHTGLKSSTVAYPFPSICLYLCDPAPNHRLFSIRFNAFVFASAFPPSRCACTISGQKSLHNPAVIVDAMSVEQSPLMMFKLAPYGAMTESRPVTGRHTLFYLSFL
ncbi:hypothetical protein HRR86_002296 [Exophiala dermatitidis]|nr:hypothetical protein HRR86_002296 [Exophiala dermatitidis]